jgi:hypothetical protein
MRPGSGAVRLKFLGLALLAAILAASSARAEEPAQAPAQGPAQAPAQGPTQDPAQSCDVPDYLLASDSALPKVEETVKAGHPLNILVVGSRSSTIAASEASAYPARLQAMLKQKLPQVTVNISLDIEPTKTAEEIAAGFVKLMEDKKPTLVIWQTGTVDAMRSVDPDDFRSAIDEGVAALQNAGSDVILMNLQYSPRTESMISAPPYLDNLRVVAQQHDVPLFDRFAIMRQWNDSGDFDLFAASHGLDLAKRVHECLGRALSTFVVSAAHIGPAQQN